MIRLAWERRGEQWTLFILNLERLSTFPPITSLSHTVRESQLNSWAQRVVISTSKPSWVPATGGVSQGSVLGPNLLNIMDDLDNEAVHSQQVGR